MEDVGERLARIVIFDVIELVADSLGLPVGVDDRESEEVEDDELVAVPDVDTVGVDVSDD